MMHDGTKSIQHWL